MQSCIFEHGWRCSKLVLNMMNMRMITSLMRSVVTHSLTHSLTTWHLCYVFSILNFGSQLDCVKPDDPWSLNLKRKAGSSLLTPASHLPQIWQKSTKKQQKYVLLRMLRSLVVGVSLYQYFIQRTLIFKGTLAVLKTLLNFWMKPSLVQLSD